ncbi:MAG: hypothetical protein LWW98_00180 [Deltaproteobacteria bacterium]|nr:hypothetical protein [Deltaproteobacteria bacterium]
MVENINIQKTIFPTSFASKVKKVDRQDADAQQKRFDKQLEEEDEKNKKKKQAKYEFESTGIGDSKETGKEKAEIDNRKDRDSDNTQGKLIDILV